MVSVIIPTLNAEKYLPGLIDSLKKQTVHLEIIVVDSSSADNTVEIASGSGARVIEIEKEAFDHGGTRALAGRLAEGDVLVYMTQDALPVNEYAIERLIKPLRDDYRVAASFGRQVPKPEAGPLAAHLRYFNYPENSYTRAMEDSVRYGIKTPFLSNSFAAYSRKSMEAIGWFKNGLLCSEDTYAGARLLEKGCLLAYSSDAKVYHSHNYTICQEFRRYFDVGAFHSSEKWISEAFGHAEGEGLNYLRSAISYLFARRLFVLLPEFAIRSAAKYFAYRLGRKYKKLPLFIIKRLSMNKSFWS